MGYGDSRERGVFMRCALQKLTLGEGRAEMLRIVLGRIEVADCSTPSVYARVICCPVLRVPAAG